MDMYNFDSLSPKEPFGYSRCYAFKTRMDKQFYIKVKQDKHLIAMSNCRTLLKSMVYHNNSQLGMYNDSYSFFKIFPDTPNSTLLQHVVTHFELIRA